MEKHLYKKVFKFQKETQPALSKDDERPMSSSTNQSINSFIVEIDYNHDIDKKIRNEIESKFKKSLINANYKFPRLSINESKGLPKIKMERRNLSDHETTINGLQINRYKHKTEKSQNNSFSVKYKIPIISKKGFEKDQRYGISLITPSPYLASYKNKDGMINFDTKRSTPSPAPRTNVFTLRAEKNLL